MTGSKQEQEGIKLRIFELETQLNLLLNESARSFTKYKGQKINRLQKDIEIYKKRLQ